MKNALFGLVFLGIGLYFILIGYTVFGSIGAIIGIGFMFNYLLTSRSLKKRDENNEKNPMDDSYLPRQ
ncbi:hypothetical protein DRW41_04865 [Neobacillus piezotolerans]|uniref:Uncharacterized protein n=1 Tax=Neobacillus piezotolerans TaxID=2259171 RepID=A0A3D8GXG2_9BACI|nr:hypothetical protein [Neobacillus piezotolerans]RDU38891.1 hypothetical protein DRW41_04865 [Neobacillus piezotolerans]